MYQYVMRLINLCESPGMLYMHQSLIILEHTANRLNTKQDPDKFFIDNQVVPMIAVKRTSHSAGQVYIASGLSTKFHFSSPTASIPSLFEAIQCTNNPNVELIFVPRTATVCHVKGIMKVFNNVDFKDPSFLHQLHVIHDAITGNQSALVEKALGTSSKRSKHSISIRLQTMHSHTQHLARYCMLNHSKPHVTNIRTYPKVINDNIIKLYAFVSNLITDTNPLFTVPMSTFVSCIKATMTLNSSPSLRTTSSVRTSSTCRPCSRLPGLLNKTNIFIRFWGLPVSFIRTEMIFPTMLEMESLLHSMSLAWGFDWKRCKSRFLGSLAPSGDGVMNKLSSSIKSAGGLTTVPVIPGNFKNFCRSLVSL